MRVKFHWNIFLFLISDEEFKESQVLFATYTKVTEEALDFAKKYYSLVEVHCSTEQPVFQKRRSIMLQVQNIVQFHLETTKVIRNCSKKHESFV